MKKVILAFFIVLSYFSQANELCRRELMLKVQSAVGDNPLAKISKPSVFYKDGVMILKFKPALRSSFFARGENFSAEYSQLLSSLSPFVDEANLEKEEMKIKDSLQCFSLAQFSCTDLFDSNGALLPKYLSDILIIAKSELNLGVRVDAQESEDKKTVTFKVVPTIKGQDIKRELDFIASLKICIDPDEEKNSCLSAIEVKDKTSPLEIAVESLKIGKIAIAYGSIDVGVGSSVSGSAHYVKGIKDMSIAITQSKDFPESFKGDKNKSLILKVIGKNGEGSALSFKDIELVLSDSKVGSVSKVSDGEYFVFTRGDSKDAVTVFGRFRKSSENLGELKIESTGIKGIVASFKVKHSNGDKFLVTAKVESEIEESKITLKLICEEKKEYSKKADAKNKDSKSIVFNIVGKNKSKCSAFAYSGDIKSDVAEIVLMKPKLDSSKSIKYFKIEETNHKSEDILGLTERNGCSYAAFNSKDEKISWSEAEKQGYSVKFPTKSKISCSGGSCFSADESGESGTIGIAKAGKIVKSLKCNFSSDFVARPSTGSHLPPQITYPKIPVKSVIIGRGFL